MATQIGLFEAKTKLSELIRKVEAGERFTITVRGKAVADVIPTETNSTLDYSARNRNSISDEERQAAFERLRNPRGPAVPGETILEWIREGRK